MRKVSKSPPDGSKRRITKFLFFPMSLDVTDNDTGVVTTDRRWLEVATYEETWEKVNWRWRQRKWVD